MFKDEPFQTIFKNRENNENKFTMTCFNTLEICTEKLSIIVNYIEVFFLVTYFNLLDHQEIILQMQKCFSLSSAQFKKMSRSNL